MKTLTIYLRGESESAYYTLKDQSINMQDLIRKALITKAAEVTK